MTKSSLPPAVQTWPSKALAKWLGYDSNLGNAELVGSAGTGSSESHQRMTVVPQPTPSPKTAFPRLPPVHRPHLQGLLWVDLPVRRTVRRRPLLAHQRTAQSRRKAVIPDRDAGRRSAGERSFGLAKPIAHRRQKRQASETPSAAMRIASYGRGAGSAGEGSRRRRTFSAGTTARIFISHSAMTTRRQVQSSRRESCRDVKHHTRPTTVPRTPTAS